MAAPITLNGEAIEAGTPVRLFQTRIWGGGTTLTSRQQYDLTSDGRFLINSTTDEGPTAPITLVLNWKPPKK